MSKPITPEEAIEAKPFEIPPEVFNAFNHLIVKNLRNGEARFTVDEAAKAVRDAGINVAEAFREKWFDVEDSYRSAGWNVRFDKSGYNEPGPDYYIFRKQR